MHCTQKNTISKLLIYIYHGISSSSSFYILLVNVQASQQYVMMTLQLSINRIWIFLSPLQMEDCGVQQSHSPLYSEYQYCTQGRRWLGHQFSYHLSYRFMRNCTLRSLGIKTEVLPFPPSILLLLHYYSPTITLL